MTYSKADDLLIGDLILPKNVNRDKVVQDAADEIDAKLGWIYKTPLAPCEVPAGFPEQEPEFKHLPRHEQLLLKSINNRLASGRLILSLDTAGQQTTLHAYGYRLQKDALDELHLIANGSVEMTACRAEGVEGGEDRVPSIIHHDEESLLLGFEETVMRGVPWYTRPGKVT